MTNISIFLQVLKTNNCIAILNANTKIIDDTLYIQCSYYEKLRKILGEQTLDTLLHDVYHTPYATYLEFKDRHPNIPLSIYNIEKRKYFP